MTAMDNDEDVGRTLREGYAAPPPQPEFVNTLRDRLRQELRATQTAGKPAETAAATAAATAATAAAPDVRPLPRRSWQWLAAAAVLIMAVGLTAVALRQSDHAITPSDVATDGQAVPYGTPEDLARTPAGMAALNLKLPKAMFEGTPKNITASAHLERYEEKPRPVFLVPQGTTNVALGKPVKSSDSEPIIGELKLVTDGDKEGTDGSYVELGPNLQWVQIDLKGEFNLYAILVWHYHNEGRVYHDFVVQVADDPDFIENVRTVYNNDYDNSAGLGIGKDLEYIEDYRGRLIDAHGVKARYVRLYSKGNTSNDQNHYIEVEVHGKPTATKTAATSAAEVPLAVQSPHPIFN